MKDRDKKFKMIPFCLFTIALVILVSGCSDRASPITTKSDFLCVINAMFDPALFTLTGNGSSVAGGDYTEFEAILKPNNPNPQVAFDFSPWDTFLKSKDSYTGNSKGGSLNLYWRQTWINEKRFIMVDAVIMQDGNIKISYLEVLG